jgi:hypothetical protein
VDHVRDAVLVQGVLEGRGVRDVAGHVRDRSGVVAEQHAQTARFGR